MANTFLGCSGSIFALGFLMKTMPNKVLDSHFKDKDPCVKIFVIKIFIPPNMSDNMYYVQLD